MTIIQNLLTVQTPETSNTTETGQELFKVDDLEITKIPKVAIPTGNNSNLYLSNYLNGYISDNSTINFITLPFNVWFNGSQYSAVVMGSDSYLVFYSGSYAHNSSPTFNTPGDIPYDKIFICANTSNGSYRSSDNINTYGYNGPVKISSGTTPNRTVTLIHAGWQGTLSTPLVWSITFYEGGSSTNPSRIDLHINTVRTGISGFYDRNSKFKEFTPESNSGYRIDTFPQTRTWTCPENVYEVSTVCVGGGGGSASNSNSSSGAGGGGLGWKNKIPVTPGSTYTVQVGKGGTRIINSSSRAGSGGQSYFIDSSTVAGNGGQGAIGLSDVAGLGGSYVGDGGGNGGNGGTRGGSTNDSGGGGGAGGYSGNGGKGGDVVSGTGQNGSPGSGGGAGGGGGSGATDTSGCGGGVGVYGEGNSGLGGSGGTSDGSGGKGGSGGEDATLPNYDDSPYVPSKPGDFGGGGAGSDNTAIEYENGGDGAVRLIWGPRLTRRFPSRNTQDLYVTYQYIKWQITESRSSSSTQASGFKLFYNQSEILYSNSTPVTSSEGSNPENLIDSLTTTKFTSSSLSVDIVIDLQSAKDITGYKWFTANDDDTQDPKSWIVYGSNDNSNWTEIDRVSNYTAPSNRQESSRMFYLPIIPR